jgi:DNA-binding MarR family transcriptional regulator
MLAKNEEDAPEEWFFYLLFQAVRRRDAAFAADLAACDLNLPQWRALSAISRLNGCTMNEVAEFTTIDRTTLTRTADQLIEAGWVARCSDPKDRRIVRLELTAAGEAVFARALEALRRFNSKALSGITEQEQLVLRETLTKLIGNIVGSEDRAEAIRRMQRAP